jgi:hypothetical protein
LDIELVDFFEEFEHVFCRHSFFRDGFDERYG